MNKKNVLLIIADQWRAQSCGYAGNSEVLTPHLDAFAAESCNLSQAISGCPVCTPARASLLTGLYPDKHGLFLNDVPLNPDLPSFGKQFKSLGYATAWFGKWHVDGNMRYGYIPAERRHGFDEWKTLECTHDYWHSRYYDNNDPKIKIWEGYDARAQTDAMKIWLGQQSADAPFCGVLSWGPPHSPYQTAPEEFKLLYNKDTLTLAPNVPAKEAEQARECLAGYYAHCTALDSYFGEIIAQLEEMGLSEDTVVMFTSDHGDFIGAHGMYDKQGPWDEAIRIPCLIKAPGIVPAGENKCLFNLTDFWPSMAGLLGQEIDRVVKGTIQGCDWSSYLKSQTVPDVNDGLFACYHVFGNWPNFADKCDPLYAARESRGIREQRYTYVEDLNGPWLLYDNQVDPFQEHNLISDQSALETQQRLHERLHQRLGELQDAFKPGMDYVADWSYTVNERGTVDNPAWAG